MFLAVGIAWAHFCLPETKAATLEDMDRVFGSHTGEEDQKILAECRRELGLHASLEEVPIEEVRRLELRLFSAGLLGTTRFEHRSLCGRHYESSR